MNTKLSVLLILLISSTLVGCRTATQTGMLTGAAFGAGTGAMMAEIAGASTGGGALIGAGIGMLTGGLIGNGVDRRREHARELAAAEPRYRGRYVGPPVTYAAPPPPRSHPPSPPAYVRGHWEWDWRGERWYWIPE